jgi:glycosyltransferase involved in cell wall biosynthesis
VRKLCDIFAQSPFKADIEVLGRVSKEEKLELMQKSHALAVTSVKEGWGLVVTEAASQGTPAVVYNVDGLRDSVQHAEKLESSPLEIHPRKLSQGNSPSFDRTKATISKYTQLREAAWHWSKEITFEQAHTKTL